MYEKNPERKVFFTVKVIVSGHGGHSSVPYLSHNPILPALRLIQIISEKIVYEFDSFQNVAFYPTEFDSGTQQNIIPNDAFIKFIGECVSSNNKEEILKILDTCAKSIEIMHHVKIEFEEII